MSGYWPSSCVCQSLCVYVCVCLSHASIVSKRLNVGSRKQHHVIAQRLLFSDTNSRRWTTPLFPWNLRSNWPAPFRKPRLRQLFAHSASTMRAGKKRSIGTNRKFTTGIPTSYKWTVYVTPKSPKGGTKRDFVFFWPVKFNFCRKKSATMFDCVKTSSCKVVATSFLYPKVHRQIAGDVHIYLKFALKVTHPFLKRRFRHISLNSAAAQPVRASEKRSIIANRKSTMRFPSSYKWTLRVTPKSSKGWLKTRIFKFGVAFHFFVGGYRRHFKFGMWIEHSKS